MAFLSEQETTAVVAAIETAEKTSSGEVVLSFCKKVKGDIYEEATSIFNKRELYKTKERNAVLIFVAYQSHKIAVLGDEGINAKVPPNFWQDVIAIFAEHFKKEDYAQGLVKGIELIGEKLKDFFPWQEDDVNELADGVYDEDK